MCCRRLGQLQFPPPSFSNSFKEFLELAKDACCRFDRVLRYLDNCNQNVHQDDRRLQTNNGMYAMGPSMITPPTYLPLIDYNINNNTFNNNNGIVDNNSFLHCLNASHIPQTEFDAEMNSTTFVSDYSSQNSSSTFCNKQITEDVNQSINYNICNSNCCDKHNPNYDAIIDCPSLFMNDFDFIDESRCTNVCESMCNYNDNSKMASSNNNDIIMNNDNFSNSNSNLTHISDQNNLLRL